MVDYSDLLAALNAVGPQVNSQPVVQPPAAPQDSSVADAANIAAQPDAPASPGGPVPSFQPAPDVAQHASLLSRIASGFKNGANYVANSLTPVPPALASQLSPAELQQAHQAALRGLGISMLQRAPDSRGFAPTFLESLANGVQAGGQAGQQSLQGSLQAQQYATQINQQKALATGRAQIAQQFAYSPSDDQETQLRKLDGSAQAYLGLGDYHAAEAAAQAARSLREGKASASANSPYTQINAGDLHTVFRKADGMYLQRDGKTWAPSIDVGETGFHASETWAHIDNARENTATHRESQFQNQFVKPFSKAATSFANWDSVKGEAAPSAQYPNGNPAATKAAITAFVGAMEPNVQLRYATLQYLSNVDPSLAGQVRRMISTGQYGALPPAQLAEMDAVVQKKQQTFKQQYGTTVARGLQSYPEMAKKAPTWEDLTGASATPPAPNAPVDLNQFLKPQ